jgi:hypothetical protein
MSVFFKTLIVVTVLLPGGSLPLARAQDPVLAKPFEQWKKEDAKRILTDSPWAIMQEVRIKYAGESRLVAGGPLPTSGTTNRTDQNTISSGGAQAPVDFQFTLRLRSAKPVRQALVRLKQIEARYDEFTDKERVAFDAKTKGLLECPACVENYVLTLSSKSAQSPGADAVYSVFTGGRFEDLKRYIYIANERGDRRSLVHFVPPKVPGDEATFFFSRLDESGAPLLTPASKELVFNVTNTEINIVANFKLDVSKLVMNGKVEF